MRVFVVKVGAAVVHGANAVCEADHDACAHAVTGAKGTVGDAA